MKKKINQRRNPQANNIFGNVQQIRPLTETQALVLIEDEKEKNIVIYGYPGTGKTWLACACAINALKSGKCDEIRIIRSAVNSRDMGFLPGTEAEKMEAYERPYVSIINSILKRDDAYGLLKSKGMLTFESSSFLRGVTYDNSFMIVDEFQNMSFHEISTIVTRAGENTRIIFCGDLTQTDLNMRTDDIGYTKSMQVFSIMKGDFSTVHMDADDIVRSQLVKNWILSVERLKLQTV